MLAGSIVPSHAYVHVVDYGIDIDVQGMAVKSGELIHADRHGACIVPADKIDAMKIALVALADKEAKIIEAARSGGGVAAIKAAIGADRTPSKPVGARQRRQRPCRRSRPRDRCGAPASPRPPPRSRAPADRPSRARIGTTVATTTVPGRASSMRCSRGVSGTCPISQNPPARMG